MVNFLIIIMPSSHTLPNNSHPFHQPLTNCVSFTHHPPNSFSLVVVVEFKRIWLYVYEQHSTEKRRKKCKYIKALASQYFVMLMLKIELVRFHPQMDERKVAESLFQYKQLLKLLVAFKFGTIFFHECIGVEANVCSFLNIFGFIHKHNDPKKRQGKKKHKKWMEIHEWISL